MTSLIRTHISRKIVDIFKIISVNNINNNISDEPFIDRLDSCLRVLQVNKKTDPSSVTFILNHSRLKLCGIDLIKDRISESQKTTDFINDYNANEDLSVVFTKNQIRINQKFSNELQHLVIKNIIAEKDNLGLNTSLLNYTITNDSIRHRKRGEKVVVEFSSPNIAKPFHAGHLRSTIQGNFISHISEKLGDDVTRITYLGDWGTQFGYLAVGYERYGDAKSLSENAVHHLYEVYVKINKDAASSSSQDIHDSAKAFFSRLESNDPEALAFWEKCVRHSIDQLKPMYKRLGVEFDVYDGESMYRSGLKDKGCDVIVERLRKSGKLKTSTTGSYTFIDLSEYKGNNNMHANILKSDGTTLYITRDYAAAIDRRRRFQFSRMLYVVDHSQSDHFLQLRYGLMSMGERWAGDDIEHVKFGLVRGMSTRKGKVVFLKDILDEAKSLAQANIVSKRSTKIVDSDEIERVSEVLGISSVIVQDLKQRRLTSYEFNWSKALDFKGDSGIYLQYTHSRLNSIVENARQHGITLDDLSHSEGHLLEDSAKRLTLHLIGYEYALCEAYERKEASVLVQYAFTLCRLASFASSTLKVIGCECDNTAISRLFLFEASRIVLKNCLNMIGLEALDRM